MSWHDQYGDRIKAAFLAAGMVTGLGAWYYYNMNAMGRYSQHARTEQAEKRKSSMLRQSVGVMLDSSLEGMVRDDVIQALGEVAESYRTHVKIDFDFELKKLDLSGHYISTEDSSPIDERDLGSYVPSDFEMKDHRLIITNLSVKIDGKDENALLGFYNFQTRTAVVHRAGTYSLDTLYNIIAHEMAHGQLMEDRHLDDPMCIMHESLNYPFKLDFCRQMANEIIRKK
ncbi:MAG: hypothetical protein AABY09_04955 [Nanoarchaeota archaeon]